MRVHIKDLDLIELYTSDNPNIIKISHMAKIKLLDISGSCNVSDNDIKNFDLIELLTESNSKITKISHITKLKRLNVSYKCGVLNNEI